RDKLQGEGESDWRAPLAVAFGLKTNAAPVGAAVATTMTWSGVLLMTLWTKMLAVVGVVAVVGGSLWYLQEPDVALPNARTDGQHASQRATSQPAIRLSGNDANEVMEASAVPTEASRVLAPSRNGYATLRGR